MKTKSKFRRAIIRSEIDKKLLAHNQPLTYHMEQPAQAIKTDKVMADQ